MNEEELEKILNELDCLVVLLYARPKCDYGGPLHSVLERVRLHDKDLAYCRGWVEANALEQDAQAIRISKSILDLLERLSPAQRMLWHSVRGTDYTRHLSRMLEMADMSYETDALGDVYGYHAWHYIPYDKSNTRRED